MNLKFEQMLTQEVYMLVYIAAITVLNIPSIKVGENLEQLRKRK